MMTTADYALIVSIISALTAFFSLGWNVWQKFIYPKARLRVHFHTCCVTMGDHPPWPRYVALSATNFGPTDVTVHSVAMLTDAGLFRSGEHALVNPIHNLMAPEFGMGPFAGGLPKKLEVGASHTAYFPFNQQSFARYKLRRVGFTDSFGRVHKAPRRLLKSVRAELDKEFGNADLGNDCAG
jgi:hypothetical protein